MGIGRDNSKLAQKLNNYIVNCTICAHVVKENALEIILMVSEEIYVIRIFLFVEKLGNISSQCSIFFFFLSLFLKIWNLQEKVKVMYDKSTKVKMIIQA